LSVSLVPPAALAVVIASVGDGDRTRSPERPSPARGHAEEIRPFLAPVSKGGCSSLAQLFRRAVRLDRQVVKSRLLPTRAAPELHTQAVRLQADLVRWRRRHTEVAAPVQRVGRALDRQLAATRALTSGPTPARLAGFNRSVRRVNAVRGGLIDFC
jgi:hypothetical protein